MFRCELAVTGTTGAEWLLLVLYTTLIAWIGSSFWISVIGAGHILARGRDAHAPSATALSAKTALGAPRVAVVMPIFHEDADRALDGLRAMYERLEARDVIAGFHFFVLSDSQDPAICAQEQAAWIRLCRRLEAGGRLFYRRRVENAGKKAGNLADFCERWGRRYDYMVVLDADSLVAEETLLGMVERMDREPELGLLQAWPVPVNGTTLFARMQQFAAAAHGRLIAAGLAALMGPSATYWGHNAIVRVSAFVESCGLPQLPGREPLGGDILSHDFVEAALLRRRGWRVRITVSPEGSYEEAPRNLLDHVKRDRRWCQGNLQHGRLLFVEGFTTASRLNFVLGIMSYCASPVWLAFVVTAVVVAADATHAQPDALRAWAATVGDVAIPHGAVWLIGLTAMLLVGPKLLGIITLAAAPSRRRAAGGVLRLTVGGLVEIVFTALIAPTMMLLHTEFVGAILSGRSIQWTPACRDGRGVDWPTAMRALGPRCLVGIGLTAAASWWAPALVWWMTPLVAGFATTVPLAVWSSRDTVGHWCQRIGVLRTPAEALPDATLHRLIELRRAGHRQSPTDAHPLVQELRTLGDTGPTASDS
ncbi:membrane glycosyltransferase [Limimonas halophila]|uniref:Glucans biosynthesis glucosyltransferase H n=2 Tax=Limimonas halophila TaxID=1082479 RepID=A0A1G7LTC8_9PROT|nr:membrane glycosyltransferase [Limimonas halophila]